MSLGTVTYFGLGVLVLQPHDTQSLGVLLRLADTCCSPGSLQPQKTHGHLDLGRTGNGDGQSPPS